MKKTNKQMKDKKNIANKKQIKTRGTFRVKFKQLSELTKYYNR